MPDTDPHPTSRADLRSDARAAGLSAHRPDCQPAALRQPGDLSDWLRLTHTPGVGVLTAHQLLAHYGTPGAIFSAGYGALRAQVSDARARALCGRVDTAALRDGVDAWLTVAGRHVLAWDDPAYPALLRHTRGAPLLLYAIGRPALLSARAIAVVGSRSPSAQGLANAEAFGHALSAAGVTVVSGLAQGIDAAAHRGGLRGPGATVAVIGTGADRIYPRCNEQLARQIAEQGCIVSEYALGTPPTAANFPRRNRIISGLVGGVLVVEAAAKSGSLITARLAGEQGRDVFAIPGSIHAPLTKGCHQLLREGARLVETAADILGEPTPAADSSSVAAASVSTAAAAAGAPPLAPAYAALLAALGHDPVDPAELAVLAGADPGVLASHLVMLELAGQVERVPGGLFQRVVR